MRGESEILEGARKKGLGCNVPGDVGEGGVRNSAIADVIKIWMWAVGSLVDADPIRTWGYFTTAIAKRHTQRTAQAAKAKDAGETKTIPTLTAYDILLRTAEWINSGRFVPPSAVNNTTRDALLRAGLVTEATLRAYQIY